MKKIGLVLEGGGMRGAYTAGCLSWLLENDYKFDVVVGISSGALYGSMFAMGVSNTLRIASTEKAAHWRNSGLGALLFERQVVGYDYMFDSIVNDVDYPIDKIKDVETDFYAGVYDLEAQETVWIGKDELDPEAKFIKAACTLPVMGRSVVIDGKKYMDGGITTMIPVAKSMELGCEAHVVISTKSSTFVRKPQKRLTYRLMRFLYRKYPRLIASFEARTEKYYEERALIEILEKEKKAINLFPSQELGVDRFGGSLPQYEALFALAYKDCEARKDEIDAIYNSVKG